MPQIFLKTVGKNGSKCFIEVGLMPQTFLKKVGKKDQNGFEINYRGHFDV